MYLSIKKKLEENLYKICQNITKTNHFNIVLLGREGVGKSTLLNSVLKLEGENMAKTGEGDSITLEIKKYSNPDPKMDFLRIYDTQGIGIKEENSVKKIFSDVSKLINEQIFKEDSNPDDLIHCIWFCFNGRFGDLEMEILKNLPQTYSDKTLPVIIVHTKTFSQSEAKKRIKKIIDTYKIPNQNICQVLAQDEDEDDNESKKKSFGIDELMKKTVNKIEAAVESANYQFTKYHIFIEVDKYLDSISKGETIFKENIFFFFSFNELKGELAKVLFIDTNNLIKSIINKELDKKIDLKSRLELFLFDSISKAESLFNLMIDEISKKHSPEIGRRLFEYINKTKTNNGNDVQSEKYYMIEYQNDIKKEEYPLRKNIKKEVLKFIFNMLQIKVMEYFRRAIKQSFMKNAREKDEEIKNLYEKFSQESIKFASEEIVKKIESSFPSKNKK